MRTMISSVLILILWGAVPALSQLPPEIQAEFYLLRAEQAIGNGDPARALVELDKIVLLEKEHELDLPDEFYFRYAQMAAAADLPEQVQGAVVKYLSLSGREGKHYREALELMNKAEDAIESSRQRPVGVEPSCEGQAEGAECWKELASHPGCHVWDNHYYADQTVTWTGGCTGGLASGTGNLKWVRDDDETEHTGMLRDGKHHGLWVLRNADGDVYEGPYMGGKKNGHWVERFANGNVGEGPYVDGKEHGHWVLRTAEGHVLKGPLVDGEKNGRWVERLANGYVYEGPYVNGKRHGQWVLRNANGSVNEGRFVDDKQHGRWVVRSSNGRTKTLTFVNGVQQTVAEGSVRTAGSADGSGSCEIPDYPSPPGGVANLGLAWCAASVSMQARAFALQAAGAQCAIATGSSSTPEQIQARRREIEEACGRLAAWSARDGINCRCPADYGP